MVRTDANLRFQWTEQPGRDVYIHISAPSRVIRVVLIRRRRSEYGCIPLPMPTNFRSCPESCSTSTMKSLYSGQRGSAIERHGRQGIGRSG
jgi:hypothetical protein